ncbi:acetyltransferase, GNAT family [Liquorilactobacillus sucicola DSM 21376 = JCM 15457]|uniref:N-acetyltransferase domain-containing protein n=1 Tax=Liquorilactobacillus sucicola DSM 21376 = JCM 15457 TaxID=1423806 RepID=A0A023CYI4_9LACO|nr:GNAT family N-acetyltransferase [Liquorilactobacillus sucicola]KRN06680.1 hypothetical protein FD15_GL000233 [Liquorilactobacillus sucicola DSM 21376 = JCM 15457]GAJ26947.1 acetyltransferase, GNAT family [Liquorilactobacillus sucicola DSM 21376 = JCM 15457]
MDLIYKIPRGAAEAVELWQLMTQLDSETHFMMYEPGERDKLSVGAKQLEKVIEGANQKTDFLETVIKNGKMIGYLSAERGRPRRIRHTVYVVIGILAAYRGQKIGTRLFRDMGVWARNNDVKRLELTVMQDNIVAQHLYEKNGFVIEGTRKEALLVDGQYVNEYYMSKIL